MILYFTLFVNEEGGKMGEIIHLKMTPGEKSQVSLYDYEM